jgi:TRAP-type mannitol/chloroaromatic compound transport system permease small subunit
MATATTSDAAPQEFRAASDASATLARMISWLTVTILGAYLFTTYMAYWWGWPSLLDIGHQTGVIAGAASPTFSTSLASLQIGAYAVAVLIGAGHVLRTRGTTLRADANVLNDLVGFIVRATFWAVLIVGGADVIISALRVEGMLAPIVGEALAGDLGRATFRGLYVHTPLLILSVAIAAVTRTLGFAWLALLVVIAEFQIVISRFIFSYEQGYMSDIVRFWYAALFLLASPYTLREEGHVRVDVVFAALSTRTKGLINFLGTLFLGMVLCWIIILLGTWTKSSVIVGPLLNFEVTQSGFGMYIKYLMAALLGMFAITMLVQFASYLLDALADYRGDPGRREIASEIVH